MKINYNMQINKFVYLFQANTAQRNRFGGERNLGGICLSLSFIYHRLRGSVSTVVTMTSKSIGKRKFRPPVDRKPLKILTPKLEWMITSWTPTPIKMQIFVEIGPTRSALHIGEILTYLWLRVPFLSFLQRVSIACYAKRCISYRKSVRLSVCPSVRRWHCVKTTPATIMRFSLEDSPMTLVSLWLTLPRNSKGNIGSEGAKWERGRKNRQFLGNKSP